MFSQLMIGLLVVTFSKLKMGGHVKKVSNFLYSDARVLLCQRDQIGQFFKILANEVQIFGHFLSYYEGRHF